MRRIRMNSEGDRRMAQAETKRQGRVRWTVAVAAAVVTGFCWAFAGAAVPDGVRELGDLNGSGGWVLSEKKGRDSPSSPQVVANGLGGSKRAAFFQMIGYNDISNDSTQHDFPSVSGTRITLEMTVKPSSTKRCITVAFREGSKAAAYVRFNGKKEGWCQHYDESGTYKDIAPYKVDGENHLKIEVDTTRGKMKGWVNGVGGAEWDFRAKVSSVNRIDLFMSHGNGPQTYSTVDDITVRDDTGKVVFSEDFERYYKAE